MDWGSSFRRSKRKNVYHMLLFLLGIYFGYVMTSLFYGWTMEKRTCTFRKTIYTFYNESACDQKLSLRDEELILIGVLISSNDLRIAKAIINTWGNNVPGKVIFFSNEVIDTDELPVVTLLHIESLESPRANLEIFKYMHNTYLNNFQYFMQIPPQSYVTVENLEQALLAVNREAKRFNSRNLYCVKGDKPIISKSVLAFGYPFFEKCLLELSILNIFSDMDIGRCIGQYVNLECVSETDVNPLFYKSLRKDFTFFQLEDEKVFHKSIMTYPIPDHLCMHHIHEYSQSVQIKRKESSLLLDLREFNKFLDYSDNENVTLQSFPTFDNPKEGVFIDHLGMDNSIIEKLRFGEDALVLEDEDSAVQQNIFWNFVVRREKDVHGIRVGSRLRVKDMLHYLLHYIVNYVNRNQLSSNMKILTKKSLVYSLFRHCPFYGVQYIVDVGLMGETKRKVYRKHAFVQVPFGPLYVREAALNHTEGNKYELLFDRRDVQDDNEGGLQLSYDTSYSDSEDVSVSETVYIIMALSGRNSNFQRFITNYEQEILIPVENVVLTIVLYGPDIESRKNVMENVSGLTTKYPNSVIIVVEGTTSNSKATALEQGSSLCDPEDLIFFIDVDMVLKADVLDRVRWLTIAGEQVYYPIVFSEYHPEITRNETVGGSYNHFTYDQESGHWRGYGYGMVSIYRSDLKKVGGFNTTIEGWGVEDVDLYHKVAKDKSFQIFRCPEPSLVHVYHDKVCDKSLDYERKVMCYSSLFSCFASDKVLGRFIHSHEDIYGVSKKKQALAEITKRKNAKQSKKLLIKKIKANAHHKPFPKNLLENSAHIKSLFKKPGKP